MLVIIAVMLVALLGMVAIVIDLNAGRNNRQAERLVTDAASTAAATRAAVTNAQDACSDAVGYVVANVRSISSLAGIDCSVFASACAPLIAREVSQTVGDYKVTIVNPIPNDHRFMGTSTMGVGGQTVVSSDGEPCKRWGVELSIDQATFFGGVLGQGRLPSTVHSVAIAGDPTGDSLPINLLILEREKCLGIDLRGGGSGGGIVVDRVDSPGPDGDFGTADDQVLPGLLAIDSDGTDTGTCTNPKRGTLHVGGSNLARADGPPGCASQLPTGPGHGCGSIMLLAPGTPGCSADSSSPNHPACTRGGFSSVVAPGPIRLPGRLTRAPLDYRYDCLGDYSSKPWSSTQPIPGCEETRSSYISDLEAFVGTGGIPSGFQRYEFGPDGVLGGIDDRPCTIESGVVVTVPKGNHYVGCSKLWVKGSGSVTFEGGNVVFDGSVQMDSTSSVTVNSCAPTDSCDSNLSWIKDLDFLEAEYSDDAAWMFFRPGAIIDKGSQASFRAFETVGYLSASSRFVFGGGGTGALVWTAPNEGPFEDLAMWSEGTSDHTFSGQSLLTMEGTFFAAVALIDYGGGTGGEQADAQFIARAVSTSGSGVLRVKPKFGRLQDFPLSPLSILIR